MNLFKLLAAIERVDPEVYSRFDSRRRVFRYVSGAGKALTSAALPGLLTGLFQKAYGQTSALSGDIVAVLNLALSLEYLELYFYQYALGAKVIAAADVAAITTIRDDEAGHVAALQAVLGSAAIKDPTKAAFDYTAGGKVSPFTKTADFLALAQAFEDTGVRAYKGGVATLLPNKDLLTAALNIHSVEARHASHIRTIRRGGAQKPGGLASQNTLASTPKSWVSLRDNDGPLPALTKPVYGPGTTTAIQPEDNIIQAQVNVQSNSATPGASLVLTTDACSEAFDEPLDAKAVKLIARNFLAAGNPAGLFA